MDSKLPILIDYGSYSTKAVFCIFYQGWANSDNPDLVFRSVISKNKDLKNIYQPILVGNQLKDFDYSKYIFIFYINIFIIMLLNYY